VLVLEMLGVLLHPQRPEPLGLAPHLHLFDLITDESITCPFLTIIDVSIREWISGWVFGGVRRTSLP
jgi:hypothetical protein